MIDAPELLSFLGQEEVRARDTTLDDQRTALLQFYNGEPYGDEEDGRSQLVTRDVAEVVDHMTVNVMRVLVSGDKVVEFEDSDHDNDNDEPEEEQQEAMGQPEQPGQPPKPRPISMAQQATEAVNYLFMKKSNGYQVIHDSAKAGLMEKTGWVKTWPEPQPPKRKIHHVPAEALSLIENKIAAEPLDPNDEGGMWAVAVPDEQPPKFCTMAVPNEEVLVAPDARDLGPELAYIAHRTPKTLSDIKAMGYDVEGLSDESDGAGWIDAGLATARNATRSWDGRTIYDRDGPMQRVWLLEEYPLFDLNGDGIAERLRVHRVGHTILSTEPVDDHPFEYWCPFPMQHRLVGQALSDKVADIQRTNSVLLRNAMDALYIGLSPRTFVHEDSIGESTIDDLLTVRPNAVIRWKGANKPETLANQDTSATAFQAIEFMIGQRESRTGITRMNQGLQADTLNKTATGTSMMMAAGKEIEEYVVRNYAEMLLAPLFAKMYRQLREHGKPFKMRIDGQLTEIDPTKWPEEIDINVRVGLGSGRKEQRLMYRMQLLGIQQQAMMAGLPIVTPEHIFNNIRGLIEDSNLGNPTDFVQDPVMAGPQQPKPDPEMAKVQQQGQLAQQKLQGDQQLAAAQHQTKAQQAEADIQIKAARTAHDAELAQQSAEFQARLANQKFAAEMALNQAKLNAQIELDQQAHEHSMAMAEMKVSQDRAGGDLSK